MMATIELSEIEQAVIGYIELRGGSANIVMVLRAVDYYDKEVVVEAVSDLMKRDILSIDFSSGTKELVIQIGSP